MLFSLISVPASAQSAQPSAAEYTLPIFETADLHGCLVDTGFEGEENYQYRFARIIDAVEDRRSYSDACALLLDGGDIYSGNVIESQQDGRPVSAAYAQARYDAVALGGHAFDAGLEHAVDADGTMPDYALNGLSGVNAIPVLCSNLYSVKDGARVARTKDYVLLEKTAVAADGTEKAVKIAVIGWLHNMNGSILPDRIKDYYVNDSLAPVDALARQLKAQGADAVVLLAHRDAKKTAAALPGGTAVDLVCGADSHYAQTGTEQTAYIQPSAKARGYAYAELRFSAGAVSVASMRTVSVTGNAAMLHDTTGNAGNLHPAVMTVSRLAVEGVRPLLEAKLGTITAAITTDSVVGSSMASTGGNWMTDLANRACGTQVSFTNSGGIGTQLLLTNGVHTVTKADIYNLAPYSNRLYVYALRYPELLGVLNWAVSHTSMNLRMSGIDCYYSDSKVTALVENGACIYKDGAWAKGYESKYVRVSCNEFVATYAYGPFAGFTATDNSRIDNESFIAVLEAESRANGGQLFVDKTPHILKSTYSGELAEIACPHEHACPERKDATCTDAGFVKMICDDCGEVISETVLPALGHDLVFHEEKTATCTEAGWNAYQTCRRCDFTTYAGIPALGHSYQNGACTRCGANDPSYIASAGFSDVSKSAWYYDAVNYAAARGLMNGVGNGRFAPDGTMTRAMLVTVLWRYAGSPAAGENGFTDVPDGAWYAAAVAWAAENGIVNGVGAGKFNPNGDITREQMAAILFRFAQRNDLNTGAHGDLSGFPDRAKVSSYAVDAIVWAVGAGLLRGADGKLLPQGSATRAQLAAILMRFIENIAKTEIVIVPNS